MSTPSSKSSDALKLLLSAFGSAEPHVATVIKHVHSIILTIIKQLGSWGNAIAEWTLRDADDKVSYSNLIIAGIGITVVFSALIWLLRLTCGQRKHQYTKRPWSPMYRKSSYSSRCLREAINSKAPFAEASRRETVLYKMGNAFTARQRRDMF